MQNHPTGPITSPKHSWHMARENGGLCTPAPASLALERSPSLLPSGMLFQTLQQTVPEHRILLKAPADVQVVLLLPELRESKFLLKSKCHQVNKESGSNAKGLCLSLLKAMPFPKSVVCC